eukprot:SAG31_NODE_35_length_31836_cov_10.841352_41_plen_105_part_00
MKSLQELTLMFDSDAYGLTFAGFLDLYRMEEMDLHTDALKMRLLHPANIDMVPAVVPSPTAFGYVVDTGYVTVKDAKNMAKPRNPNGGALDETATVEEATRTPE